MLNNYVPAMLNNESSAMINNLAEICREIGNVWSQRGVTAHPALAHHRNALQRTLGTTTPLSIYICT
jgi:hypothetical protein